jgi:hypothetical protein
MCLGVLLQPPPLMMLLLLLVKPLKQTAATS